MASATTDTKADHKTPVWVVPTPSLPLTPTQEADLESKLSAAAALLQANEVVGFPTETVYGLGGNALSDAAIEKIFAAKGRPRFVAAVASNERSRIAVATPQWAHPRLLLLRCAAV
jgi:tRNA A37 threonylcarbamoyladenosine synthetase subunit TsaC/SUA5/YrdC